MSRFSKFCKFLAETGEGLKLVAFFVAAQRLFIAHYEDDPDFAVFMGQLRLVSRLMSLTDQARGFVMRAFVLETVKGTVTLMKQAVGAYQPRF